MPKAFDFGGVNLTSGGDSSGARPSSETPFRIAILGDFSGRTHRGISDTKTIAKRRALLIDRDNFDEVLSRIGPELEVAMGDGSLHLRFSELDDFHPDQIFQQLEAFNKLRELRGRLQDPFGHMWAIATHKQDLTSEQLAEGVMAGDRSLPGGRQTHPRAAARNRSLTRRPRRRAPRIA